MRDNSKWTLIPTIPFQRRKRATLLITHEVTDARWGCVVLCISWYCPNYTVGQTGRAIYTAKFAISGDTTGRCCCGHSCENEALQWVYWKRSHAAITTPEKERLCIALLLSFMGQAKKSFWSFFNHSPVTILRHSMWRKYIPQLVTAEYHVASNIALLEALI